MTDQTPTRRRMPDLLTLLVGLFSLGVAGTAFAGLVPGVSGFDPRWLLAGAAVGLGVLLLVGSLRNRDR
ncbi:hypothetical protein PA7_00540 [Pseudonocardia asaccharolytica DSM 44247 = NBRC 16224]|uniref:Uncharacterized protein n=2 Tax=Pseudonocardia asaccharolytica TaxID=54010 RepID=A0A511CUU2_9PSEU|nr:hypothetical protein PA7_00540 [Pseudonocardia asaccharolytica DSM 44247 = NBRC 16224]